VNLGWGICDLLYLCASLLQEYAPGKRFSEGPGLTGAGQPPWYSFRVIEFQGVYASAITPRGKKGEVDYGAAFELIDYLFKGGVNGIVLFGAEGEYPAFTTDERCRLVYLSVKRSRVPILACAGAATLDVSVSLAREAYDAGAEAVLVPPPHFFRYDQDDLRAFYCQFAGEVPHDLKLLLYNVPGSASPIADETAAELLASGRFAGIVQPEGAGSLPPERVLAGDESLGTAAVVSAAACAVPELVAAVHRAGPEASRLRASLEELLAWAARFPNPSVWKVATGMRGLKTGALAAALSARKQRDLDAFREWFAGWLPAIRKLAANA
jgi:4-hydroxy-tetrahydrodipicolinate synthase